MAEGDWFTQFEELGVPQVRALAPQWDGELQRCAYKWLRLKDAKTAKDEAEERRRREEEARRIREASQAEQIRVVRGIEKLAMRATVAALVAVPASAIAIVISLFAWLYPRH